MASDFQDPIELIPRYIDEWKKGNKIILGEKISSDENEIKFSIRKLFYNFLNRISDFELTKNTTGSGIFDKSIIEKLKKVNDPYPYFRGLISEIGEEIKMDIFNSMHTHIRKFFKNEFLIKIIEFPFLFLGATPKKIPALYSLINYADMKLGTWYPKGGMYSVIEAMINLAKKKGVIFYSNNEVTNFYFKNQSINKVATNKKLFDVDIVVSGSDYHHTDQKLLPIKYRNYSSNYWEKRIMTPSSLLFYIGTSKKIKNVKHHCLFFDKDFEQHAFEIYNHPQWPTEPLFYASFSSKDDPSNAPKGCENIVLLVPIAAGLKDSAAIRKRYYELIMNRLELLTNQKIKDYVIFKKSYSIKNFEKDYNSYKGNAYGLANTLFQTAIFKPSLINKKLSNFYYCGQLTVPGPGVPPSIISGEVVAKEIIKKYKI